MKFLLSVLTLVLVVAGRTALAVPCSETARAAGWQEPTVEGHADLAALVTHLTRRRVVYVGELHDRFEHHLTQLEIICRLQQHGPLAIGAEFFQTPAQGALDDYVMRHGDLTRLLRESQWFSRWRYDPRLYAPILRFARRHRIRIVALNVPGELTRKVARGGMASLSADERARLPAAIDRGPPRYVQRIRAVFEEHPSEGMNFENFLSAQLLWDEGMAQRGAEFMLAHAQVRLVVLAGEGHVAATGGIPDRLARRLPAPRTVVSQSGRPAAGEDVVQVTTPALELPRPGRLGVRVEPQAEHLHIAGFSDDSAARDAGLRSGDRLLAVDRKPVNRYADLRLALWQRAPGDALTLTVARDGAKETLVLTLR